MPRSISFCLLALMLASASSGAQSAPSPINRVAWMAGCWEIRTPTRVVEEYWMIPRAGMMLGMARTVSRDTVRSTESSIIRQRGDRIVYEARPSDQATTIFPSIAVSGDSVVFELLTHDFPQRVGYNRRGTDSLVAWIEGTSNGRTRRISYPYARVACPTAK